MCRFQNECERTRRKDLEKIKPADQNGNFKEREKAQKPHPKMEELRLMEEEVLQNQQK